MINGGYTRASLNLWSRRSTETINMENEVPRNCICCALAVNDKHSQTSACELRHNQHSEKCYVAVSSVGGDLSISGIDREMQACSVKVVKIVKMYTIR